MNWDIKVTKSSESRIKKTDFNNLAFGKDFTDHMFIADYYDGKWQDCRIVPFGNIEMHPASFVLHYAQSIFEGLKAELSPNNEILLFRPDRNADRFAKSAERLAMPEVPKDLFLESIQKLIEIDKEWIPKGVENASLYVRPFLFATDPILGVRVGDTYRYMVIVGPAGVYYSEAVKVWIQDKYVRAFPGGTGEAKFAGNYAATLNPVLDAKKKGCAQILWTDGKEHKYFQEIGTMNIFFVIDNVLITPSLEEGTILHGVTRESLMTLAKDFGIKVEERKISVDEFLKAVEEKRLNDMFGAGTAAVVQDIDGFVYEDQSYDLSWMPRKESKMLKRALEDIKEGKAEDKFNWIVKIN
jgi:branched-chain amino acid aminotransferase